MDKPRIAIIDDEVELLEYYRSMLEGRFQVHTFRKAEEALASISDGLEFDTYITDIKMGGMTGFEFTDYLTKIGDDIPVIVVTGFADKEILAKILKMGAFGLVEKPAEITLLYSLINKAVVHKRLKDQNAKLLQAVKAVMNGIRSGKLDEVTLNKLRPYLEKVEAEQRRLEEMAHSMKSQDAA